MKKLAISIGDINGVGIEIAIKAHEQISRFCTPVYFINKELLSQAANLIKIKIPSDFCIAECGTNFKINPSKISKKAGKFSFISFLNATLAVKNKTLDALVTLPINKQAWKKAGIKYHGHTDALSDIFNKNAIMMLGCNELFVALFTDHIPLKNVAKEIKTKNLVEFLYAFAKSSKFDKIGVLGLNPHCGDGGVIGNEDSKIKKSIFLTNQKLNKEIFYGPLVPDVAFNECSIKNYDRLVAMYHDQGLAPLKALYFKNSINVSLNLPIIRTSPDHGTAFDIAYQNKADITSYVEAVKYANLMANKK